MSAKRGAARYPLLVPATLCALMGACSDSDDSAAQERMFVFIENLAPLNESPAANGTTYRYALWRTDVTAAEPRLVDRFDAERGVVNRSFAMDDTATIATLFVTIENRDALSDTPSRSVLIAGDVVGGTALLSVEHPLALAASFDQANGTYRLATPTTVDESDFDQGVWWYDVDEQPVQSLFLPGLPQGWLYEGWIISGDQQRSTGKFADPARFDLDAGGASAGGLEPPPFPGQDYVFDPFAIVGTSVAVTIEPNPDTSLDPFSLRVMFDQIAEGIRVNQPMENVSEARLPTGSVTTNRPR